ncbi:unnamed protein product [Pleuronectes platessa]|uniref:Uncharacterized protein n=1 Tax=Pleuronectes platessa TaxID=8262 RepID=A0A9N7TZ27_PLEPL|nr:unnamed protein product [Pleuronectes platessa]
MLFFPSPPLSSPSPRPPPPQPLPPADPGSDAGGKIVKRGAREMRRAEVKGVTGESEPHQVEMEGGGGVQALQKHEGGGGGGGASGAKQGGDGESEGGGEPGWLCG